MGILVLTGLDVEARGIARRLRLDRLAGPPWPHYRNELFEVAPVGLGAVCLAARAACWRPPSLVLSCGVCGALAPHLSAGDVVIPEIVLHADGPCGTAPLGPIARGGAMVSMPHVVNTRGDKARLHADTGALAVDMETAAILAWATARGLPGAAIRGVSDGAEEEIPAEILLLMSPEGAIRRGAVLHLAMTRPHRLATALRIGRATRNALDAVAQVLLSLGRQRGA